MPEVFKITALVLAMIVPSAGAAQERVPEEVRNQVLTQHNRFFALREMGRFEDALALMRPAQRENYSLEAYQRVWGDVRERLGRITELRVTEVTWYRDMPGAPPGLYAALDYRVLFERDGIACGYLVWAVDDDIALQREEVFFLDMRQSRPQSEEQLEAAFGDLGCR